MQELIKKILQEATLEKDLNRNKEAKEILLELKNKIENYKGFDGEYGYNSKLKVFFLKVQDLEFALFDRNSPTILAKEATKKGIAFYNNKEKRIYCFDCIFKYSIWKRKIVKFDIDFSALYHEVIHFFDLKDTTTRNSKKKKKYNSDEEEEKQYYNDSVELNAHFMEKVFPLIERIFAAKGLGINVIHEMKFNEFKKIVFENPRITEYYEKLNEQNQRRFLKRLAEYYQKLIN